MPATTYTPESAESILLLMRDGKSLRKACQEAGIKKGTFLDWVEREPGLADQYARAREEMMDTQAEELESIGEQAARAETAAEVAGLRLQSDNRKWLLSKLAPKKYGEKLEIEQRTTIADLTEEQIDARIAQRLNEG
jgi:hypothetical protein